MSLFPFEIGSLLPSSSRNSEEASIGFAWKSYVGMNKVSVLYNGQTYNSCADLRNNRQGEVMPDLTCRSALDNECILRPAALLRLFAKIISQTLIVSCNDKIYYIYLGSFLPQPGPYDYSIASPIPSPLISAFPLIELSKRPRSLLIIDLNLDQELRAAPHRNLLTRSLSLSFLILSLP